MRVHVLLDYYDVQKLQKLPNGTIKTPTLFQTTGQASDDRGFLNVTDSGSGSVSLVSAAKGTTLGSTLVKSIASQPFNISILQITNVIIPLGIDSSTSSSSSSPSSSPTPSSAPSPNAPSAAPSPASSPTPAPDGSPPKPDAPADDHDSPSASSVLGVSLVFLAISNLLIVLMI